MEEAQIELVYVTDRIICMYEFHSTFYVQLAFYFNCFIKRLFILIFKDLILTETMNII